MVLYSNVDKGIDLLLNNKELIISVLTMLALVVKIVVDALGGKKTFTNIGEVQRTSIAVGRIVDKGMEEVSNKVETNSILINNVIESYKEKDLKTDELIKLFTLVLQTANIPITHKKEFLDALNSKGEVAIDKASKSLESNIEDTTSVVEKKKEDLELSIETLEELE